MGDQCFSPTKLGYSIREACDATSIGKTTLYGHIAAGRLRTVRVGGRTIIPTEALRSLLQMDERP